MRDRSSLETFLKQIGRFRNGPPETPTDQTYGDVAWVKVAADFVRDACAEKSS